MIHGVGGNSDDDNSQSIEINGISMIRTNNIFTQQVGRVAVTPVIGFMGNIDVKKIPFNPDEVSVKIFKTLLIQ